MATAAPEAPTKGAGKTAEPEPGNSSEGAVAEKAEQQQLSLLPQIDGRSRTLLRLAFTGNVDLEPHDLRDAELAGKLQLGATVAFSLGGVLIEGIVRRKADQTRTDDLGYVQDVRHTVAIEIHSLQHPASEADKNTKAGR